jgi:APA family basic amino acid/polyamine antiporter
MLQLKRELGIFGAILMGLGSMVGTGVFVSIGIAAGIAGPSVILAVILAAGVALCNGLSSAQLAVNHPISGGTYEYGYKYLTPWLGFTAGWVFLLAKSASAATAALGFAGYLLNLLGVSQGLLIPTALIAVVIFVGIVLGGIQRSHLANIFIVTTTLFSLIFFVIAGLPLVLSNGFIHLTPFFKASGGGNGPLAALFHATALMFVAYTGYGRIATLGEEVRNPTSTIPRAIMITMLITMGLYTAVAVVGIGAVGAETLSIAATTQAAPLAIAARQFKVPLSSQILAIGAMTSMLGVLLNLILGLSRMLLAMGRRRDMPPSLARLNKAQTTPYWAVLVVGFIIAGLVLIGNVKTTWSFSAFTVLVYYALTNLAALRLSTEQRLYPPWISGLGLLACLFLAFWVERQTWLVGLGLIFVGLAWHAIARLISSSTRQTADQHGLKL